MSRVQIRCGRDQCCFDFPILVKLLTDKVINSGGVNIDKEVQNANFFCELLANGY